MNNRTWKIEDHLCQRCGGRILRCVTNTGMSPGGTLLFRCADCGESMWGMSPDKICWCGMKQKFQSFPAYRCLPYSILTDHPELLQKFLSCGCDPQKDGEVGIIVTPKKGEDYLDKLQNPEVSGDGTIATVLRKKPDGT